MKNVQFILLFLLLLYSENMFQSWKICELDESILENMTLTFSMSQEFMKIPKSVHFLFQNFDFFYFTYASPVWQITPLCHLGSFIELKHTEYMGTGI